MISKHEVIKLFKARYPDYKIGYVEKKGNFYIFYQAFDFDHPERMITPGYPIKYDGNTNEFSYIIPDKTDADEYGYTADEMKAYLEDES